MYVACYLFYIINFLIWNGFFGIIFRVVWVGLIHVYPPIPKKNTHNSFQKVCCKFTYFFDCPKYTIVRCIYTTVVIYFDQSKTWDTYSFFFYSVYRSISCRISFSKKDIEWNCYLVYDSVWVHSSLICWVVKIKLLFHLYDYITKYCFPWFFYKLKIFKVAHQTNFGNVYWLENHILWYKL